MTTKEHTDILWSLIGEMRERKDCAKADAKEYAVEALSGDMPARENALRHLAEAAAFEAAICIVHNAIHNPPTP